MFLIWMEIEMVKFEVTADLVKAVKAHAITHYDTGHGWDEVVECWSDEEIARAIHGCRTLHGAVRKIGQKIAARAAYAYDIVNA